MQTGQVIARQGHDQWPVVIEPQLGGWYKVMGRSSRLDVYIKETDFGLLVSVPNYQRCGYVPYGYRNSDFMQYVDIDNITDATTLAAALRYIMSQKEEKEKAAQ